MIIDSRLEFADAVSVAAAAGTALIGNVVDLGTDGINDVDNMFLVIQTDTEIITAGSAGTLQFKLASDAQAAIATDGTATDHLISKLLVTDDAAANSTELNAGQYIYVAALPKGQVFERYLGILAVTATTTTTAGKINAFLTNRPPTWKAYDSPAQA
jgi:hypothetical protein